MPNFLSPLGHWITIGGIVALVTVKIAIAVASVTKYKVTVQAHANLRPAGELRRLVQAATGASTIATTPKATAAFYEVTIEPEGLSLGRETRQCSIKMGMEGRADIISKQETVLQFFLRKARLIADV